MKAVTFNVTIPSYIVGKTLGLVTESALYGGLSGVRFGDVQANALRCAYHTREQLPGGW